MKKCLRNSNNGGIVTVIKGIRIMKKDLGQAREKNDERTEDFFFTMHYEKKSC